MNISKVLIHLSVGVDYVLMSDAVSFTVVQILTSFHFSEIEEENNEMFLFVSKPKSAPKRRLSPNNIVDNDVDHIKVRYRLYINIYNYV